jgi:NodT family efflux transporter outer membrane factor (OMF) lipoprotein
MQALCGRLAGIVGVLALLATVGCAARARQPYVPPPIEAPAEWSGGRPSEPDLEVLASWWLTFGDTTLTSLVTRAVGANLDLRSAVSRLRQARASLDIARRNFRPTADVGVGAAASGAGEGPVSEFYRLGFDAGWELDVFGGIRSTVDASTATLGAREADLHDILVTLVAEVGIDYINVRSLQSRLTIALTNLASQQETYELARFRAMAGLTSELDVEQARAIVESTRAQIPSLEASGALARHRLELLLGGAPGSLTQELAAPSAVPVAPLSIALGVPADTLRRRPDVRSAERVLAAQTAAIGTVRAQLYPRFGLLGSIGLDAVSVARLFASSALGWSVGPSASLQVFDRGQIRRSIDVQTELQEQALVAYETTVLAALAEVEDALVSLAQQQVRREHLVEAVDAAEQASVLSRDLYAAGLRDFRDVLDAQRSLLSFQDQLAVSNAELSAQMIRLFKALGGGWSALASMKTSD